MIEFGSARPGVSTTPRSNCISSAPAREQLHAGDAALRKGYMHQLVERVEVAHRQIRVIDPKSSLANGVQDSSNASVAGVPSFGRGWWAQQDSNLRPAD